MYENFELKFGSIDFEMTVSQDVKDTFVFAPVIIDIFMLIHII